MSSPRIKKLLDGKVVIESLISYKPPFKNPILGRKRLMLEKGELAEIYSSSKPVRFISYVEFPSGKTRGGHYHNRQEFFYIIRGEMIMRVADSLKGAVKKFSVKEGDLVSLAPKVAHILTTVKPGHALEFSGKPFNPKDSFPYQF